MHRNVIAAIFRRNFVSYFANPTGYVFICVFVLLGSFAAFWPDEFFNANLANLDQLNKSFPFIMLVFIPAITMSIWADERRQGTDELLLTIPAADIDVVLGKYFAAVAIFTVALLFSLVCNLLVLYTLGLPDPGLFVGTYFGYWMVGLAMLAIGMVGSFLTGNLTVAFILGVAFNAPLVFLNVIDTIVRGSSWTATAKGWSIGEEMSDFGHGVMSLASIVYFLSIAIVMLYLCMVLIGRRHWLGGRNGKTMGPHYVIRSLALLGMAAGVTLLVQNFNFHADVTQERLNSVASESNKLISNLDPQHPVVIEAFVSRNVPEEFVQTRMDLLNLLREFEKISRGKVTVKIYPDIEPLTEEAERAEQQYGIVPQEVFSQSRGMWKQEQIYLAAAITCGLEKMVIPFFERGIPVEYELVRSLSTITQQKRKRLGIVQTDAELFGGFDFSGGQPQQKRKERLVEELEKQYDVVRVDPNNPITEKYDAMLAIQPSSLGPAPLANFVDAVKRGQPTAIFEDPLPGYVAGGTVPGTGMPKRSRQNPMMPFGAPPPEAKGDINQLWDVLGVELVQKSQRSGFLGQLDKDYAVVWQDFKPRRFQGLDQLTPEFVFISRDEPDTDERFEAFNDQDPITSGLQELIFPLPGGLLKRNAASTEFTPLVKTGNARSGMIMVKDLASAREPMEIRTKEGLPTNDSYVIAAHITGNSRGPEDEDADKKTDDKKTDAKKDVAKADAKKDEKKADGKDVAKDSKDAKSDDKPADKSAASNEPSLNVVLVADADVVASAFFDSRARRSPDNDMELDTDNVTFVLNALDLLADDMRFIDLRKRRPLHRPLTAIVDRTQAARDEADAARTKFEKDRQAAEDELDQQVSAAEKELKDELAKMQRDPDPNISDIQGKAQQLSLQLQLQQRKMETKKESLRKQAQQQIDVANVNYNSAVSRVQNTYKLWSVILPPIPPLLVAFFVFFNRRTKEREGVSKARLR